MGKDNQPKARQAAKLARKRARRAPYDRILIVSEGTKTEPHYFGEIRAAYRLHTANVQVQPGAFGTNPLQVVEYAEHLFLHGDEERQINPRAFEQVFAVFDRDDHHSYHNALAKAGALDRRYRTDLGQPARFCAVPSVPSFELWLLLHFEEIHAPIHRDEVYERLRGHLPGYEKGQQGVFEQTNQRLAVASERARHLASLNDPNEGEASYTGLHLLVELLTTLRDT